MDSDETGVYPTIIDYFDRVWMPSAITRVPQSYCSEPVRNPSGTDLGRVWTDFPNGSQSAKSKTGGTLVIFAGKVGHVERVYGHKIRLFPIDHRKKIIV